MIVKFDSVSSRAGLCNFSLSIPLDQVTLLYDPSKIFSASILRAMLGLDEIYSGNIYYDGIDLDQYFADGVQTSKLGYVFDEGIMLSNLSLQENLLLPLHWVKPELDTAQSDALISHWMELFELKLDLKQRPELCRPGQLKLLGFVRTLLVNPNYLLLDDPFYLLNKLEREILYRVIKQLKASYPMLIASIDDEFGAGFADAIIDLSSFQDNFSY
ncbi:MAG: phospholipid/cholesterol/gamma-HCH transport system ATP-binding protein [Candidatus Cloacimonadota bacterium]|nr:phospholipid/cholesterol/gamma-HCH transport system ATP-binding protein [Candidatus Cloacimonadota bacterium]